ncbi:hypothetical protein IscW_ISCW013498 [Ixodes scapularis]|uniref:Uncharacterized protein n=1 Tax=Ixodes scapularis TaxID=6945 RepID=B7QFE4_IXOSC|nr:hypothetical protein IscW_ISCW013498 [Ixodes scapularis]|eukprot:XP_002414258.1 hypothetical protein IscW_ISCW013498 [Ixodes scapularis]
MCSWPTTRPIWENSTPLPSKYVFRFPVDLEKHYHVIHEIAVHSAKAEFSEAVVFVCVPPDVTEDTTLNSTCRFCDLTLRTLSEVGAEPSLLVSPTEA